MSTNHLSAQWVINNHDFKGALDFQSVEHRVVGCLNTFKRPVPQCLPLCFERVRIGTKVPVYQAMVY